MSTKKVFRLIGKLYRLNRQAYTDYKERRAFLEQPKNFWCDFPERVFSSQRPVFFLSTGRCGTALITSVLNQVPGIKCYHKPVPEFTYLQRKAYEEGLSRFKSYKAAVCAARFEYVAECVVRGKVYVETNCRITFFAPHLYELFPHSRFVHLIRHPGRFVRSAVQRKYYKGGFLDIGRIRPIENVAYHSWPSMSSVERAAWLWNETNIFIERFKENCDPARILTIKAEDIFSKPKAIKSIIEYCGGKVPSTIKLSKLIRRPINSQKGGVQVPKYEDWDDAEKNEVRRWASLAQKYYSEI